MKRLDDGTDVPARVFYYLLDWNERDGWKKMISLFTKQRLCTLELHEFIQLFKIAIEDDLKLLEDIDKNNTKI